MASNQPSGELFELFEALCNDRISPEQHQQLQELLKDDPEAQRAYLAHVDLHLGLKQLLPPAEIDPLSDLAERHPAPAGSSSLSRSSVGWMLAAALAVLVAVLLLNSPRGSQPDKSGPVAQQPAQPAEEAPILAQRAAARFVNEPALPPGSPLALAHSYGLTDGLVQLRFKSGAEVIIEAPAVFEIPEANRLVMNVGQCSVYAPDGAEGFRVETPLADVVDRGTRFSVSVGETGETDVQVVEGEAELLTNRAADQPALALKTGQARRYDVAEPTAQQIDFDGQKYRRSLPDRVINYRASQTKDGRADELQSVTVQRGGREIEYAVDELIGIDLIHFRGRESGANITTPIDVIDPVDGDPQRFRRADLLDRDRKLTTGVINPGGSKEPLTADPVLNAANPEDNTPGFAIRFQRPVVNGPGPDVVFFDLHVIVHPEGGDPFHVSPLHFAQGLHAHTINRYDIDLTSPEAQLLGRFRLYRFPGAANSLEQMLVGRHNGGTEHVVGARGLAAGIDLSDLGYAPGAEVSGLFFQDILDDQNYVDPVFIAGLPTLKPQNENR